MHSTVLRFSRECSSTFGRVETFSVWPEIELLRDRSCISCQSHCGNAPSITVEKSPSLTLSALSSKLLEHNCYTTACTRRRATFRYLWWFFLFYLRLDCILFVR